MARNRAAVVALLAVGTCWLVVWPAFMRWMVFMEAVGGPDRPGEAAWRLWRALEILLVEPKWIANTLAVLIMGTSVLGAALLAVGIATLRGNARAPKWAAVATAAGVIFCLVGFVVHRLLLMPAVNASKNPEVVRASGDLALAIPVALAAGFVSLIVAGLALLAGQRPLAPAGSPPPEA
jgi:hypothetical protein